MIFVRFVGVTVAIMVDGFSRFILSYAVMPLKNYFVLYDKLCRYDCLQKIIYIAAKMDLFAHVTFGIFLKRRGRSIALTHVIVVYGIYGNQIMCTNNVLLFQKCSAEVWPLPTGQD